MSWQPSPSPRLDCLHCIPGHRRAAPLTALSSTSFVKGKLGSGPTHTMREAQDQTHVLSLSCPLDAANGSIQSHHEPPRKLSHLKQEIQGRPGTSCQRESCLRSIFTTWFRCYYTLSLSLLFCKVGTHSGFAEQLQLRQCSQRLARKTNSITSTGIIVSKNHKGGPVTMALQVKVLATESSNLGFIPATHTHFGRRELTS